jgi:hypothetical protein
LSMEALVSRVQQGIKGGMIKRGERGHPETTATIN